MRTEDVFATVRGGELEFTELVAVRHGLTDANAAGILQGQYESHLDERGREQAQRLGVRLARENFSAIYASTLERAWDTARIIAGHCGAEVIGDAAWREWNLGRLENTSYAVAGELYPELIRDFKSDAEDIVIPEGESKKMFYARISRALEEVAARHHRQRVLIVTHGGVLQAILKHVMGGGNCWNFLPRSGNASYNKFVRRDNGWQLCCWNDTAHLEE